MAKNTTVTTKKKYENRGVMTKDEYEQQRQANPQATMPSLAEMYQQAQDEYDAQKRRNYASMQAGNQIMTNLATQKSKPAMQMELGKQLAQMDQSKGTQTKARKLQLTKAYMDAEKGIQQKQPVESKAILPDTQVRQNYTDRLNSYLSSISKKSPSEQYEALGKDKKSSWLNPSQSKELMDIVGVDAAKKYINDNPYDLAGKQKELATWKDKKAAAENKANKAKADLDAQRAQMTPEEMQAAREEAWNLKGQQGVYTQLDTDGLKVSWRDSSGGWHNDDTFTKRPDDYYEGTMREEYDALLYDKIHGDGAYMQRVDSLQNDTETIRLENEMDDLWNRLEHHTLHAIPEADQYGIKQLDQLEGLTMGHSTEQRAAESEARYAQDQIKSLENEIRFLQEYEDLMGKHATPDQVGYIPENDRGQDDVWGMEDNPNNGIRTNDVHRIYSFANKGKEFIAWAPANKTPRITDEYSGSLLMNDKELATFNGYYNNQQYKEASAFLQALQPYLRQRYSEFSSIYTQENAKVMPITASGAAQAFMAADTVIAPIRTVASIFDPTAREADSAWYQTAKQADTIQQTIANDLGGTAGKAYLSFMNSLRNVINATMTKGLGATEAAQKAFGLTTFASQIFQESTYKYLKETHNNYKESIGLAALDAVMETLEEMLPYEAMLNTSDRPAIRLIKNMLSEAGEEFTGATVGEKIRGLVTGRDNVQKRADEIFNQGGYYDANGRWIALDKRDQQKALNTADMQAIKEWHQEIVENTIGGAAGGGFGSVYGSIANRIDTAYKGREIKSPSNTENGKSGAQRLYEIAIGMDENTKSRKLADKIKTTDGQVQKVGDYQLGRLAKAIAEDTGNKYNETIKGTVERDAKSKLMAAGIPEGQARIYADVIARDLLSNKAMNKADIQTLARDRRAIDVYRGYTVLDVMSELQEKVKQETKPQNSIMETITRMVTPQTKGTSAMARDVEESIAKTSSPAEALDYLMTRKAHLVTERFAKKAQEILEKNESARNSKNFVDDAMKVMLAAKSLDPTMPKVQMDEAAAQELYDEARKEFDEKDAERIKAQLPAREGEGVAEYDGAEYGTDAWKEKVQGLSKTARNQMGAIGEIATRLGLRVKMINDTENTNVYGYEMSNGTIYLNVAGLNRNKMSHHMLVTMAHEMTHWLEQNSLEGYRDLRQYALDNLRKEGKDVAQLMMKTIENQNRQMAKTGEMLDMTGAMAEIVAKSCENILSSQEMINTLQDINPSLYNKVKSFVRNFVARVNAAIEGMDPSLSEEARALRKYTDEIAKRWLTARKEAMGREAQAEGQEPEEKVQFRLAEDEKGKKNGSLTAAADIQAPASTSETTGLTSNEIITQEEDRVKRAREEELDEEYMQAILDGNEQKQLQLIREKFNNTEGIYPFYAPRRYIGTYIKITKAIKEGDMKAISLAASEMAKYVPDNAVLIPMPGHTGIVTDNTDTMLLAKELSRITGKPVINALEGNARDSRFVSKRKKGAHNAVTAEEMGFRQVQELPEGSIPMIVDNVVAVGETAKAAIDAIPGSSVLSYTKGMTEEVSSGLKAAYPTKDKDGNWIPLSKKGDINNPNWRYSVAELSDGTRIAIEDKNILDDKPADMKISDYIYNYLFEHINDKEIAQATSDVIYLGKDLPHEYISSEYTNDLKRGNKKKLKIKNRAASILLDAIYATYDKKGPQAAKHNTNKDAKYGVYKYKTRLAFPVKNASGDITGYNAYTAQLVVNHASNGRLELYDVLDINRDDQSAKKLLNESAHGLNIIRQPKDVSSPNLTQKNNNGKSFSLAELDNEYNKAVDSGNVGEQQKLVDEAAKQAGYTMKVYHGTPTGGFTQFRDWSYFTENKQYADRYNHASASSNRGYAIEESQPMTYELYMNPGRVFDTRDPETAELFENARMEYGLSELQEDGLPDWTDGRDIIEYIEDNDLPYDTIILNEGADGGYGQPVISRGLSYVTRSNLIKSAAPVTYDDAGNVVPLSERFNVKKKDIRFSLANAVEEREDGLVAVHNLTYENLVDTLKEGGFTAPSIAVIKAKTGHTKYGEISVVFNKDAIDPKVNSKNKIYGADAYTPTRYNVDVETELIYEKMNQIKDELADTVKDVDKYGQSEKDVRQWFSERSWQGKTNKTPAQMAEEAYNNLGMLEAYLATKGETVEPVMKEEYINSDIKKDRIEAYQRISNALLEHDGEFNFMFKMDQYEPQQVFDEYADIFAAVEPDVDNALKLYRERGGKLARNHVYNWMKQVYSYVKNGAQTESRPDWYETKNRAQEKVSREELAEWLEEKLKPAFGQTGIRNSIDEFTYSGERRSWSQLHVPYTIENIVKEMYKNATAKGQGGRYASGVVATASKEYGSLEETKADAERLRLLDEQEYQAYIDDLDNKIKELGDEILPGYSDTFDYALIEAGRYYSKNQTLEAIKRGLASEEVRDVTNEQLNKIKQVLDAARAIPTGYFEAKPERVVGFDEIAKVIIPARNTEQLQKALDNAGIEYDTYDGTDEDRLAKLNAVEGVQFSIQDEGPDYDVERFMRGLSESSLKSEQEKTMFRQWKQINQTRESYEFFISDLEGQIRKIRSKVNLTLEEDARHAQLTAKMTRENLTPDEIIEYKKLSRKAELSVYDRQQISKKQALINEYKKKIEKVDKEYVRVTRNDGYARLMQRNRNLMDNLLNGVTADKLQNTVRAMENQLSDVTAEMAERKKQLDKLAEAEAVLRIRTQFNRAGLRRIASELKNNLGSDLDTKEIENKLALIALKMKQGQMDTDNVQELADLLLGGVKTQFEGTFIDALRGSTITLGKTQLKELEGQGSSLSEVRDILAGTGIRIGTTGNTTLDEKWNDLCDIMPSLDRQASPGDQLDEILKKVKAEKRESGADIWTDENKMRTAEAILTAANNLLPEIIRDEKSQQLIKEVMQYVHSLSEETKGAAQGMTDITALIDRMKKSSRAAVSQADTLTGDINVALDYYNKLSLQSEAAMWKEDRVKLIEQMKNDSTKALLEERDKWQAKIQKDKQARETMADNMRIRKSITTNISRLKARLINETDQKNITEHMKNLARDLLGKIVDNDLYARKITGIDRKDLLDISKALGIMDRMEGGFTLEDLKLIHDEEAQYIVENALADLEDGIREYNDRTRGKDIIQNLTNFHNALNKIYNSVTAITNVISAENSINYMDRTVPLYKAAYAIKAAMSKSRFKGELTGKGSKTLHTLNRSIILGNTTPEYFFKNLRNQPISELWDEAKRGENRNGLELQKAKDFLQKLAAETHYANWANETREISLGGQKTQITIGNVMELYAIWRREMTENPEMSSHIEKGGVFFENNANQEGRLRREYTQQKARRLSDAEIMTLYNSLTKDQQTFLDKVVGYLSNDMSKLGNEASMRMYGIEKYKETYYFPMKIWDGVRSARSDKGITGTDENRAAHKSWSKRRINFASNPLVIGDFMTDAVNHIVEMINYNTMAPAIENLNKVLNLQLPEIADDGEEDKRNVRIMFQEAYGRDALNYLETLLTDMNGGVTQDQRKTLRDILLSTFKKNSVAGSLSVAAQQPLSYIRAAMLINPVYLAKGLTSDYFKGAYKELLKYSGVAVLKQAGKFDMNFGSSAKEYITPEKKEGKLRTAVNWIGEKSTALPEKMDAWTWTRMWAAVKAEQHAQHKDMNVKSDAFLQMCAERFNELMRRTQVYDSVLVKSSNMRSKNYTMKVITSFMAEPTLSLNVLADAWINIKEKGGKAMAAKALATFALSAAAQAGVKALMSSGRSPDKKKTWAENYLYKLAYNLINEANPLGLIPGYSSLVDTLVNGELNDNSMSVLAKAKTAAENMMALLQGGDDINLYRTLEDSIGQLLQLASNVPAKNIMRDFRAMVNIFSGGKAQALTGNSFAQRENSAAVMKYQLIDMLATEDLLGLLNKGLGEAGYQTSTEAYYGRMYEADKQGKKNVFNEIAEYIKNARLNEPKKGTKDDVINSKLRIMTKEDESLSHKERIQILRTRGMKDSDIASWIASEYKEGNISKQEAAKLYVAANPVKTEDDAYFYFEQKEYEMKTGIDLNDSKYFRLYESLENGSEREIKSAQEELVKHGVEEDEVNQTIKRWIMKQYKDEKANKEQTESMLKKYRPEMDDNDIFWALDLEDYKKETGNNDASGKYYRLNDAMEANKGEAIRTAIKTLLAHGAEEKSIRTTITNKWKEKYLAGDVNTRSRIREAIRKAYQAIGLTSADADKVIDAWKEKKKK